MRLGLVSRHPRRFLFLAPLAVVSVTALAFAPSSTVAATTSTCTSSVSTASGVVSSFCFQPAATNAGSAQTLNTTIGFSYPTRGDTVTGLTVTLPPGLLAIPSAVSTQCTTSELAAGSCPAASQVGSGTVKADGLNAVAALYAMPIADDGSPTASADVAYFGLDIWLGGSQPTSGTKPLSTANAEATIVTSSGGQPQAQFAFAGLPTSVKVLGLGINLSVSQLTLAINGTVAVASGSTPYTRLPTNCSAAATTSLSVTTVDSPTNSTGQAIPDGAGTDSFTPSSCGSLAFTPGLSATAVRDASDLGVQFVNTVTQPANQAATQSITLDVPPATLGPNLIAAAQSFNTVVGSAQAVTPLLSTPLTGTVSLTGTVAAPTLTIALGPPVPITLTGTVNILANSVTFSNLPDVPLSSLSVTLNGGPLGLYATTCAQPSGTLVGVFGGQNGATATVNSPFTISNCSNIEPVITSPTVTPSTTTPTTTTPTVPTPVTPPTSTAGKKTPPKVSHGSLGGLTSGSAKLRFTLTAGSSKLTGFTVSLPSGLRFDARTFKHGVTLADAHAKSETLSRGHLVVTLRGTASKVSVTLSAKAIDEVAALRSRVRHKQVKTLRASIAARTAGGSKTLTLTLKV